MVLPTGTITMTDVNREVGFSDSTLIDLNATQVRRLCGLTTNNSTISMNNLRGQGATLSSLGTAYDTFTNNPAATVQVSLNFLSDGTWNRSGTGTLTGTPTSGNWFALGSTANIGLSYWIRFTATVLITSGVGSFTASTGWLYLDTTRTITVSAGTGASERSISYLIEISSTSTGGGNFVRASSTSVLTASVQI